MIFEAYEIMLVCARPVLLVEEIIMGTAGAYILIKSENEWVLHH